MGVHDGVGVGSAFPASMPNFTGDGAACMSHSNERPCVPPFVPDSSKRNLSLNSKVTHKKRARRSHVWPLWHPLCKWTASTSEVCWRERLQWFWGLPFMMSQLFLSFGPSTRHADDANGVWCEVICRGGCRYRLHNRADGPRSGKWIGLKRTALDVATECILATAWTQRSRSAPVHLRFNDDVIVQSRTSPPFT